jgi:NAD(P)H-nitrite reductase large subunit
MRYVIVGGSAAAVSAVEAIRSVDETSTIALFSDEETPLFSRVLLPYYIAEELPKSLLNFRPLDFFELNHVNPHLGVRVNEIRRDSKTVLTEDGQVYEFDKLLLATGGKAIIPPVPGVEKEGIFPLKTMEQAERVYNYNGTKAVVIGAGSIGVESCISLVRRGLKVTLLEQMGHVLPTVFDEEAASIIQGVLEDDGIEVVTGEPATDFNGNGRVECVVTSSREIPCDMVVLAAGVRPNTELAEQAGVEIGATEGIKVDDYMMTSEADIFAAGDVCETMDIARGTPFVNAIWPMAVEQGRVAGLNMAGQKTQYPGSVRMNSIGNFIGLPAMSIGVTHIGQCSHSEDEGHAREIKTKTKRTYKKLILRNGRIVGAIFVGQTQKFGVVSILLRKQIDVSEFIPELMSNSMSFMDLLPLIRRNADQFTEPEYKELMDTGL